MQPKMKKALLTGLGLAALTKKEIEKTINQAAVKKGLSQTEGEKLAKELLRKMEKRNKAVADQLADMVKKALKALNIPTRQEVEELDKKVDRLNKKVDKQKV
jgi:polyhydroxyalkanoate synthesis regulator phasin